MKTLIIDNTIDQDSWGSASLASYVTRSKDRTAFVRRAPHNDLPKSIRGFDNVILSGSKTSCLETGEWISKLDSLLRDFITAGKPILGVCYGHQALNRVLGGKEVLAKSKKGEFGWTEIEIIERAPLFEGLPDRFWSFSSHFEEVVTLPKGMRHLARSADCAIQACRLDERPIYGIQFHPEKDVKSAEGTIAVWKKRKTAPWISREKDSTKLYNKDVGDLIFENFLSGK